MMAARPGLRLLPAPYRVLSGDDRYAAV